jgi:hypothetical protein
MPDLTLTLVTVVFERELEMLGLQARSVGLHGSASTLGRILVIDNTQAGMARVDRERLMTNYGPATSRVQILRSHDVATIPQTDGWRSQQVLKLAISARIDTPYYLILDAKTHLLTPLDVGDVLAPDGRARVNKMRFSEHALRPSLERALRWYGLPVDPYLNRFSATVPPFVMTTATATALVDNMVARTGQPFPEAFLNADLTEFFAYTAFSLSQGADLNELFDFHQVINPAVWARFANDAGIDLAVDAAAQDGSPFFSVHRDAYGLLSSYAQVRIAQLWFRAGLFSTEADARRWLARQGRRQRNTERQARLRTRLRRPRLSPD